MIMAIGNLAFSSVLKKQNLTGYIQYYKKMVGQTEPQFLSDPMSNRKKKFSPTLQYRMFGIIVASDFVRKALISV